MPAAGQATCFQLDTIITVANVQVIIEGFKSYKDQTISEPFSPRINIVGA